MFRKMLLLGAAAAGTLTGSAATAAPLIGDTVTCSGVFTTCSQASATVGDGIEFSLSRTGFPDAFTLDLSEGILTFSSNFSSTSLGIGIGSFTIADPTNPFTQATVLSVAGVDNLGAITLNNGALNFQFGANGRNTTFFRNSVVVIQLGDTPAVPEPATWAMMIGGFGLVGGAMRRRHRMTIAAA